jgi:hypothetical protein
VATTLMAILLGLPLIGQFVGLVRRSDLPGRPAWAAAAWRVLAAGVLLALVSGQVRVLRLDEVTLQELLPWNAAGIDSTRLGLRSRLLPVITALAMIGIVAGMRSGSRGEGRRRHSVGPRPLMVLLAALAGVLLMTIASWIPYLVLIAIEGVRVASDRPPRPGPGLWDRLGRSGWEALAAGLTCLITALVVARDLSPDRAGLRSEAGATPRLAMAPRLIGLLATVAAGGYLLLVTLPTLHPDLSAGLWHVLGAGEIAAIVAGFAALAAGLAAGAIAPGPAGAAGGAASLPRRIARATVLSALLVLALGATINHAADPPHSVDPGPGQWVTERSAALRSWISSRVPHAAEVWPILRLEVVIWAACLAWLPGRIVRLPLGRPSGPPSPFDAIAADPGRWPWFLWCWSALTAILLASLPIFFLAGLVLFHLRLNAGDLFGWPF